jgi:Kef-type K+ transport system membrane component KefB
VERFAGSVRLLSVTTSLNTTVLIMLAAFIAPYLADLLIRWVRVPSVVLEIILGAAIGPAVLGWAHVSPVIDTISELGLAMLMFLAGYEIRFDQVRGKPIELAVSSWVGSAILGTGVGVLITMLIGSIDVQPKETLHNVAPLVLGLSLTTTALGTMLPMVSDAGLLSTPVGGPLMAVGATGEFFPIVMVALLLTEGDSVERAALLIAFVVVAALAAWLATRPRPPRLARLVSATLTTSAQLAVRLTMVVVAVMLWIAIHLGLDMLLGAFAAGVVMRLFLRAGGAEEIEKVESKLEAIGYGFLIPFFFVVSGMELDLRSLASDTSRVAMIPLFLVSFLIVRGIPVFAAYRWGKLPPAQCRGLALFASTGLPLIVAITTIGVQAGAIRASTAASLVVAGLISVMIFPLVAIRLASST